MTTYTRQNKKPKPVTVQQRIDQFRRDMKELGFDIRVQQGNGRYSPLVSVEAWPKREGEAA